MPRKKILLYCPKTIETVIPNLPLSLLSISSLLYEVYDIIIIDGRIKNNPWREIRDHLNSAFVIGISVLTGPQIGDAIKISRLIKKHAPHISVIWGGWHPTILPEQTVCNEFVDYAVIGQGQRTFARLIKSLDKGNSLDIENTSGICFEKDSQIIKTDSVFEDLDNFPPLPLHLVDVPFYVKLDDTNTVYYESSQGCPFKCGFCADYLMTNHRWKGLSPDRVIADLDKLINYYKARYVYFVDNNMFVNEERVRQICRKIIVKRIVFKWKVDIRTDKLLSLKGDTLELMKEAGCDLLMMGAESGSEKVLKSINKKATVVDTYQAAERLNQVGIKGLYLMVFGLPEETKEDRRKSLDMLWDLNSKFNAYSDSGFYVPYPGTVLFEEAIKRGYRAPNSLMEWSNITFSSVTLPWIKKKDIDYVFRQTHFLMRHVEHSIYLRQGLAYKNVFVQMIGYFLRWYVRLCRSGVIPNWTWDWRVYRFLRFKVYNKFVKGFRKQK